MISRFLYKIIKLLIFITKDELKFVKEICKGIIHLTVSL